MLKISSPSGRASQLILGLLISVTLVAQIANSLNIDTEQPILREVSELGDNSLFGYSLVLHQLNANPTTMAEALSGARIVVSAPKGTAPDARVNRTGLVYSCPVNPGNCSPLPGKLADTQSNDLNENKGDQFLGASMASNGERFMVCAHRYTSITSESPKNQSLFGKCFYTDGRSLEKFNEYQPCDNEIYDERLDSVCQAGTSSTIVPDGTSFAFGLGAPGMNEWRGAIIRRNSAGNTGTQSTSTSTDNFSYQGYAITAGRFLTSSRLDFAVSLPRHNLYFGSVNIVMNDNNLQFVSQPLAGKQMGEYYGFSLLAVDLNGDGYDELLVGAPLYRANSSQPEAGRVFLYKNNEGNLELLRTINGQLVFSRFGYAMANLGDISGDGHDDVAISAPFFNTTEPGTVYIYHSHPTLMLNNKPSQIIRGTDLKLSQDLSGLRGFGTSLASGVDVDMNGYNDLLIGSFLSQKAFLLRTHPIANVQASITAEPQIVDVMNTDRPECMLDNVQYACFNLTACATYTGENVARSLPLRFSITGDTQSITKRLFFENRNTVITINVTANIGSQFCTEFRAFIQNNTLDVFNPFVIEMSINVPSRAVSISSGNDTVEDLSGAPILVIAVAPQTQVETLKQCDGGECIPNLVVSATDSASMITVGLTSSIDIILDIKNNGNDAFQAIVSFIIPTTLLEFVNAFNQTSKTEVSLSCISEQLNINNQVDMTRYNCSIGNPFSGPGGNIRLRVRFNPQSGIVGNENSIMINFTVSSLNPENNGTLNDNFARVGVSFEARANITIDNGVVTPEQLYYSDNTALSEPGVNLSNTTQLGPGGAVSFLIRNLGPSRIPQIQLDISWPLNGTLTEGNYYLYITSIEATETNIVTCSSNYVNPLKLSSDNDDSESQGGDSTVNMASQRRRRRKRSTEKRKLRYKRQDSTTVDDQDLAINRTLNCSSSNILLNCIAIRCTIMGMTGSSSIQVDVNARLDERFYSTKIDRYSFVTTASISIVNGDYIVSNDDSTDRSAVAEVLVNPASQLVRVGNGQPTSSVQWWVIVVPIVAGLIVIVTLAVILWMCGFFRRKKHEEIKQKREELRNLTAHGVSPGDNQNEQ